MTLNNWLRSAKPKANMICLRIHLVSCLLSHHFAISQRLVTPLKSVLSLRGPPQVRAFDLAFRAALTRVVLPAQLGHSGDAR